MISRMIKIVYVVELEMVTSVYVLASNYLLRTAPASLKKALTPFASAMLKYS